MTAEPEGGKLAETPPRRKRRSPRDGSSAMKGVTGPDHPRALYDKKQRAEALRLAELGVSNAKIARQMGCNRQTVARWIFERDLATLAAEMAEGAKR